MSRKHFEVLAKSISKLSKLDNLFARVHACTIANSIATICAESNAAFDRKRFMTACGFPEDERSARRET